MLAKKWKFQNKFFLVCGKKSFFNFGGKEKKRK